MIQAASTGIRYCITVDYVSMYLCTGIMLFVLQASRRAGNTKSEKAEFLISSRSSFVLTFGGFESEAVTSYPLEVESQNLKWSSWKINNSIPASSY